MGTTKSDQKVRQWEQEANAREVQRSASGNRKQTRGNCKGPPVGTDNAREGSAKVRRWERTATASESQDRDYEDEHSEERISIISERARNGI